MEEEQGTRGIGCVLCSGAILNWIMLSVLKYVLLVMCGLRAVIG